jgi:histidine triad (HIT) family protein
MKPCPFCEISRDFRKAITPLIQITRNVLIIEPRNPVTPGHALVISRVHVANFALDPVVFAALAGEAAEFVRSLREPSDWNLITSMGPSATQTIEHLHIHLVPRREGDGLRLPWSPSDGQ